MKKEKQISILVLIFLLYNFLLCAGVLVWIYKIYYAKDYAFEELIKKQILGVSTMQKERLNDYVFERKNDLLYLSRQSVIKEVFDQELSEKLDAATRELHKNSDIISQEIENYLRNNPDLSLDQLLENDEFTKITIYNFGEAGFTRLLKGDTFEVIKGVKNEKEDLKRIEQVVQGFIEGGLQQYEEEFDFYYKNKRRRALRIFKKININLLKGELLVLDTIVFVDNFLYVKDQSEINKKFIQQFVENKKYKDIIFINNDTQVIFNLQKNTIEGLNLLNYAKNKNLSLDYLGGIFQNYILSKSSNEVKMYGPYYTLGSFTELVYSMFIPVYDDGKIFGYLGLVKPMDEITGIVKSVSGLGVTGDNYLVNTKGELLTPLRYRTLKPFSQEIKSRNQDLCLRGIRTGNNSQGKVNNFQNYLGNLAFGTFNIISDLDWCLLTELEYQEVFEIPKSAKQKKEFSTMILTVSILLLIEIVLLYYTNKRFKMQVK